MKLKQFFICSLLIFASAFAFAEKSRFYEDGRLIDNMYVDATSGLRVRDKPDLSGNKICSLENAVIVKVVAIGKTECIDDKNDPWVEILIPAYMWKNKNVPEYGWVYGGYLVSKRPASKIPLLKGKALEDLLVRVSTWQTEGCQHFTFYKDGRYYYIDDGIRAVTSSGTFRVNGTTVILNPGTEKEYSFSIKQMEKNSFTVSNSDFVYEGKFNVCWTHWLDEECPQYEDEVFYFLEEYSCISLSPYEDVYDTVIIPRGFVNEEDEEYMKRYRAYWNPIMQEHQKKADKM